MDNSSDAFYKTFQKSTGCVRCNKLDVLISPELLYYESMGFLPLQLYSCKCESVSSIFNANDHIYLPS